MKVLVTGAAGQVGCRLIRCLLERNHDVRGTILPDDPCRDRLSGLDVQLMEGDLTDDTFTVEAVNGVEAVIHTANIPGPEFDNNVRTNRAVAAACGKYADALDRLVYVSSSSVFPNNGEQIPCAYHPVDELHPKRPSDEYGLSKLIGEQLVEMVARQTGLRTVIVRPSHVLSGAAIRTMFTVAMVCEFLRIGQRWSGSELHMSDGTELWRQVEAKAKSKDQPCAVRDLEGRPWYYQPNDARDVAHGLMCALERPEALGESFNLSAPAPFLYPEGAAILAEHTGQDPLEIQLPVRWRYDHDMTKARGWIGYSPRGDLASMMTSARRAAAGEGPDYDWDV